jgi:hypothetical protein
MDKIRDRSMVVGQGEYADEMTEGAKAQAINEILACEGFVLLYTDGKGGGTISAVSQGEIFGMVRSVDMLMESWGRALEKVKEVGK